MKNTNQNLLEYIKRHFEILGESHLINEVVGSGKNPKHYTIADDISSVVSGFVSKLNNTSDDAARELSARNTSKYQQLGTILEKDIDDLLEFSGRLKDFFKNPLEATLFMVRHSPAMQTMVEKRLKSINNSDFESTEIKNEVEELIKALLYTKYRGNQSDPNYIKLVTDDLSELYTWITTKEKTDSYLKNLFPEGQAAEEMAFREWLKVNYPKDTDVKQVNLQVGTQAELMLSLKNKYGGPQQWDWIKEKYNKENGLGAWSKGPFKPRTIPGWLPLVGGKTLKVGELPLVREWRHGRLKQFSVGKFKFNLNIYKIFEKLIFLATFSNQITYSFLYLFTKAFGGISQGISEWWNNLGYPSVVKEYRKIGESLKEEAQNGFLVRQILEETVTRASVTTKYGAIMPIDEMILLDESEADAVAKMLITTPYYNIVGGIEWTNELGSALRDTIYDLPDGLSLIYVVERFKVLNGGKNPVKYWEENIKDWEDNKERYFLHITNARSGQIMLLSIGMICAYLKLTNPFLDATSLTKASLDAIVDNSKLTVTPVDIDANAPEIVEIIEGIKKLMDTSNWFIKRSIVITVEGGNPYEWKDFDWSKQPTTINTLELATKRLEELIIEYLKSKQKANITVSAVLNAKEIEKFVNERFSTTLKNMIVLNPGIFTKQSEEYVERNPEQKQEKVVEPPKPVTPPPSKQEKPKKKKKSGVAFENYNVVGLGKLLIENQSTTGDFDWRAALFQNFKDITEPTGWKGDPPKKVNQNPQNGWGTFDKDTKTEYDTEVEDGSYPKELIDQVEKVFFKLYNKKFRFELNDSGDFITLQGNPSIYQSILDTLNYGPTQDFEAIFFIGIMKIKEYKGTVTSIQVSDATEAILKKNELIIKQIINPKDK